MMSKVHKRIRTLTVEDLKTIFVSLDTMPGWRGSLARGMCALYFATGVRPSELRRAELADLKLEKMQLYIRHPKGEGSWGIPEDVEIIREDMLPMIVRYLKEREAYLNKNGASKVKPLFPCLNRNSKDGFYSAQGFGRIKEKVVEVSGVDFRLKDFRSTLTSLTVNGDMSLLPAMSAQLRHSNMATTQKHYAAIEQGAAGRMLRSAWRNTPIMDINTVIKKNSDLLDAKVVDRSGFEPEAS